MIRSLLSMAAALIFVGMFGCSTTVPPRLTVVTPISDFGEGRIFVKSNRDEARIAEAFRTAGMPLVAGPHGADLVVNALLGKSRGSGECGTVHNMQLQLMQGTYTILRIVARGPTGHCAGNIMDQVAMEVKSFLDAHQVKKPAPPPPPPPAVPVELPEPEVTEPVKTGEPPAPRRDAPSPRPQLGGAD